MKSVLLLVINFGILYMQESDACITPNGESARCIPVRSCKVIVDGIKSQNPSAIEFAQKSQCGFEADPLVCCGSVGHFTPRKPTSNIPNHILPNNTVCGFEKDVERVKGGEVTRLGEFPWTVALEYMDDNGDDAGIKCGGSLINQRYVLTAAHCTQSRGLKVVRAWLGEWILSTDPDCQQLIALRECADPVQKVRVVKQISHPDFNRANGRNDIALLKLERDIQYSDYIRPICLPNQDLPNLKVYDRLTVTGWGITDDGKESDIKLKVDVPLLSNQACNAKLPFSLTSDQYCAGGEDGKDSCRGDSGGPLMRAYREKIIYDYQWYLEGVISFGLGCGRKGYPAIYTRVLKYVSWIVSTISNS